MSSPGWGKTILSCSNHNTSQVTGGPWAQAGNAWMTVIEIQNLVTQNLLGKGLLGEDPRGWGTGEWGLTL